MFSICHLALLLRRNRMNAKSRLQIPSAARDTPIPIPIFVPVVKPLVLKLMCDWDVVGLELDSGVVDTGVVGIIGPVAGITAGVAEVLDALVVLAATSANTYPLM